VRDELINVLSQTGGHLGPNLGVVELTIALHRVFDTPRDRFVMDVSHQGYVHKMLPVGSIVFLQCDSSAASTGSSYVRRANMIAMALATLDGAFRRPRHGGGTRFEGGNENIVVVAGDRRLHVRN